MANIIGRAAKGGKARAEAMTPEQRSESARKAVTARWAKARNLVPLATVSVSVSADQNMPVPPERINVELRAQFQVEPQISGEVTTWTSNSLSYVITPRLNESSTQ